MPSGTYLCRMAEIRTVTTLRSKRAEIIAAIANYEKRLAQARADLVHITAAITIFEASGDVEEIPPYVDIHRCFKRGGPMQGSARQRFAEHSSACLKGHGRERPRYRRQGTCQGRRWATHSCATPTMPARAYRRYGKAFWRARLGVASIT
jgi:hypothetical protein